MTLAAAPTTPIETPTHPVDAARVLGGCRGPGASARLSESGLLDLTLAPAEGGTTLSTAAEVVRVLAVSHLDLARRVRRSLLDADDAAGHDLTARVLDIAIETGVAAAAFHGAVAAARDGSPPDEETRRDLGELSLAVAAAESTLAVAASAVDAVRTASDDLALLEDEAAVAVTTASVLAARASSDASCALVDLGFPAAFDDASDLGALGTWVLTGRIAR